MRTRTHTQTHTHARTCTHAHARPRRPKAYIYEPVDDGAQRPELPAEQHEARLQAGAQRLREVQQGNEDAGWRSPASKAASSAPPAAPGAAAPLAGGATALPRQGRAPVALEDHAGSGRLRGLLRR